MKEEIKEKFLKNKIKEYLTINMTTSIYVCSTPLNVNIIRIFISVTPTCTHTKLKKVGHLKKNHLVASYFFKTPTFP